MCEEENEENWSESQKDIIKIIAVVKISQVQQLPLLADLQIRQPPFFSTANRETIKQYTQPPSKV